MADGDGCGNTTQYLFFSCPHAFEEWNPIELVWRHLDTDTQLLQER